jgi:hypothetical protein
MGPHNSDARQPQDTSEWPPAIIVDLSYAAAALKAWSPNPFIEYVREQSRDAYYCDGDDQNDSNSMDGSGPSCVNARMCDQTTVQFGSGLHSRNKTLSIPPKGRRHIADMMDIVSALWMQSSRVNKIKQEDAQALSLARNEGVKAWLQSQDSESSSTI